MSQNCCLITVNLLYPHSIAPFYHPAGSGGILLFSRETITLNPFDSKSVKTGISIELPSNGIGLLTSLNEIPVKAAGVIENVFHDELAVPIYNINNDTYVIHHGDPIAQLLILPNLWTHLLLVDNTYFCV